MLGTNTVPSRWVTLIFFFCSLAMSHRQQAGAVDTEISSLKEYDSLSPKGKSSLKKQYDSLTPKGKFATGAVVGFVSAKAAVGLTVKSLKVAGATFVVTEVMDTAGLFKDLNIPDYVDDLVDDVKPFVSMFTMKTRAFVNDARLIVRETINPINLRANLEKALKNERLLTLGTAAGAVLGLAL